MRTAIVTLAAGIATALLFADQPAAGQGTPARGGPRLRSVGPTRRPRQCLAGILLRREGDALQSALALHRRPLLPDL